MDVSQWYDGRAGYQQKESQAGCLITVVIKKIKAEAGNLFRLFHSGSLSSALICINNSPATDNIKSPAFRIGARPLENLLIRKLSRYDLRGLSRAEELVFIGKNGIVKLANLTKDYYMKTISATDAKNKFGSLMSAISAGPIAITKNGKVAAYLTPSQNDEDHPLTVEQLDDLLNSYASGKIARRNVEEATGLWFSDILAELRHRGLQLPKVDTRAHLNDKQLSLYNAIFSKQ
jgi:prevent-host-death family protein